MQYITAVHLAYYCGVFGPLLQYATVVCLACCYSMLLIHLAYSLGIFWLQLLSQCDMTAVTDAHVCDVTSDIL